ncbi:MAG: hypothetical protein V9G09_10250 [Candidatus Nanopelagicales bacterium]
MASDNRSTETGRWASEGGADPRGPATHVPAVEKRRVQTTDGTAHDT